MKRARERSFGSTNSSPWQGFTCGPSLYSQTNFRIASNSLLPITPYGSDQLDRLWDQSGPLNTTVLVCLTWNGVPDGVQNELRVTHRYSMWYLKKKNDTACGCKTSGVALYRQVMFFLPFFLVLIFLGRNSSKNFQEILTKMT
jgi:hypothetical protein